MLSKIREIIGKANPSYKIIYEERSMMNVSVDGVARADSFAYIEEFTQGRYYTARYGKRKALRIQIYFSKFVELEATASDREDLRNLIENEIVLAFMEEYSKSRCFVDVDSWNIYYPPAKWDANEVSVLLDFYCEEPIC